MSMWNIFRHLLPRAHAWRVFFETQIYDFFKGLGQAIVDDPISESDKTTLGVFPEFTEDLDEYEEQFNILPVEGLTDAERAARIEAAWKAIGGQSPSYIQGVLQKAGFDLYVHDWYDPSYVPPPVLPVIKAECGETPMECGEEFAECGNTEDQGIASGEAWNPIDYIVTPGVPYKLLINKDYTVSVDFYGECGEPLAECGEPTMECGNYSAINYDETLFYIAPYLSAWYYYIYIGSQTFISAVNVPSERADELEDLVLSLCPTHKKIVLCVNYT